MRFSRERADSSEVVESLREAFQTIDARWNAAGTSCDLHPSTSYLIIDTGVYLQLLEAQEVMSHF